MSSKWNATMTYRVYADGTVVHEDEFDEWDNSLPYYDDYGTYTIPLDLDEYLRNCEGVNYE